MTALRLGRPGWLFLIGLLALAGTLRAFALWAHDPLYAYANSYDQTRYTNCFRFYPDRGADVPPQQNSPEAPYAHYRFIESGDPMCYWSSELVFTGATAAIWTLEGGDVHAARWVGALRWLALLAVSLALSTTWLRRGDARAALANAALLPLVFADPGNTLYLNTFYAEWTALLAAYALMAAALLWRDEPATRWRFGVLAFAAFALATAKIQHLLLPLCLGVVIALLDRARLRRFGWRAGAVLLGALAGAGVQVVQLNRGGAMMDAIDQYNRADVLFTALLPFARDPAALLGELGIDPACATYSGLHAWEFPDLPEKVCRGLDGFSRGSELATLAKHPDIAVALAVNGVLALDPWIAKNLGQIEGGHFATIANPGSIGVPLHRSPPLQWLLLAVAPLVLLILMRAPGVRRGSRGLEWSALTVTLMLATLAITVLGDGLADTAKQGHLILDAALALVLAGGFAALLGRRARLDANANANGAAARPR